MSSAQARSKPTFYQVAMPATGILLAGLSLFYSLHGDGAATPLPASAPSSIVETHVAESAPADTASYSRLSSFAARGNTLVSANANAAAADPKALLAQLHATMRNPNAKLDRDRMVVDLESQHKAEPVDPAWSAQSEVSLMSAAIQPVALQSELKPRDITTDCRSRTCRVSARFSNSGDASEWGGRVITQMGGTLAQVKMTVIPQPDGSSEIRMYGSRKQPSRG